jgi:hypothetical protein
MDHHLNVSRVVQNWMDDINSRRRNVYEDLESAAANIRRLRILIARTPDFSLLELARADLYHQLAAYRLAVQRLSAIETEFDNGFVMMGLTRADGRGRPGNSRRGPEKLIEDGGTL